MSKKSNSRHSAPMQPMQPSRPTWLFNWVGGGYNTVQADTREEALRLAKAKGAPSGTFNGLTVDERTLHVATDAEIARWDAWGASMFN